MYHHILIATDGSPIADKALIHGLALAKALGAKITVLTVVEPPHTLALAPALQKLAREDGERVLDKASQAAKAVGVECRTLLIEHPHPHESIIKIASEGSCGVIVMASHGRQGVAKLVLGSETTKVLTQSKIPVLVYR
jgi:nucleotide-binding universal stress UspA family protein